MADYRIDVVQIYWHDKWRYFWKFYTHDGARWLLRTVKPL